MASNKLQNLKVNPGVLSSRFVIDLKQNLLEAESKPPILKKAENFEEKLEKLAEVDYGKYFVAGKEKGKALARTFFDGVNLLYRNSSWIPAFAGMTKESKFRNDKSKKSAKKLKRVIITSGSNKLDQLAFIGLGKLLWAVFKKIFGVICKICHSVGWTIVFILRLVYFILLAIIRPVIKIVKFLFFKSSIAISGTLNVLPAGYQATQTVAVSIFVRLLQFFRKLAMTAKKLIPPTPLYQGGVIGYLKPALVFAGILLIIVLPVKAFTYYKVIDIVRGKVLGASEIAMSDLVSAGESAKNFNFGQAGQGFERAGNNFLSAQNELKEINGLIFALASVLPDKNMRLAAAGKNILRAGESSANAGKNLSLAMASLFNQGDRTDNILNNLSFYGHNAIADLTELDKTLGLIDSDVIPESYQKRFILLKQKTGEVHRGLTEFISLADSLGSFLGESSDKRYLLVFQNNSELRATGGFIGSFALIDFSKGGIKNIEVPGGGSYDTEAGFLKKIKAPQPLSLVRADWHFWDANWWPDWPTSARKLAWFYENSDGSTVDGVIGFTPTVMEKLLTIIGPVDLRDKYGSAVFDPEAQTRRGLTTGGLIIDADNFWLETQKLAEQKPDVTRQPKKIIGDLMNKIIEELPKRLSQDNLVPLFKVMEESLSSKNVLFYFTDKDLEARADDLGWSGKIKNTDGDYLNVINTNIAGGKSDRRIKQEIIHEAQVQPDGSIIDNLTIRRVHEAVKREPFSGVRNVDWIRVYVPLGSTLLEAGGFRPVDKIFFEKEVAGLADDPEVLVGEGQAQTDESSGTKIYNELGKTVFANWSQLDPSETIEINIKYRLPFKITDKTESAAVALKDRFLETAGAVLNPEQKNLYSYSLLVQKQPGMNSSTIESELKLNGGFTPIWRYPADLGVSQNGWSINENLNQDKIMGIIVEEK